MKPILKMNTGKEDGNNSGSDDSIFKAKTQIKPEVKNEKPVGPNEAAPAHVSSHSNDSESDKDVEKN